MSNVVDLTRRRDDGKLRGFTEPVPVTTYNPKQLPDFLQEVDLGRIRACYFVNGVTGQINLNALDNVYYDLAWMKIPAGFEYVQYEHNGTEITNVSDKTSIGNNGLLATLLLLSDSDKVNPFTHICSDPACKPNPGWIHTGEGCSLILKHSFSNNSKSTNFRPFELLYFDGELRLESGKPDTVKAKFYLIPIILSERNVVYYAIKSEGGEIPKDLKTWYTDSMNPKKVWAEIRHPLVLTDELGIFTSTFVDLIEPEPINPHTPTPPTNADAL